MKFNNPNVLYLRVNDSESIKFAVLTESLQLSFKMVTTNRATPPTLNLIEKAGIIRAEKTTLDNGISLYAINAGEQDVVKVELLFDAGSWPQSAPLVASATNNMLEEGTSMLSARQIAEKIDFHGAFIDLRPDKDIASVSLYSLNKHLENTLSVVEQMVKDSIFPQREFDIYVQNARQKFKVENEKVKVLARKHFLQAVFGNEHPYGKLLQEEHFAQLERQQLVDFYKKYYSADNCTIIVSGKVNESTVALIEKHFGKTDWENTKKEPTSFEPLSNSLKKQFIEKKGALQSAIRIGRKLFNKTHPNFQKLFVLETVLGGYFGSRLMANIREDKGYTYGIGSAMIPMKNDGYFFITTEVGADVTNAAIDEIYFEMKRLREEVVPDDELQKVKNYMMGELLRSMDGPFSLSDRLKGLLLCNLDYDYYEQFVETVKNITSDDLIELAQQYFKQEDMHEIVIGQRN